MYAWKLWSCINCGISDLVHSLNWLVEGVVIIELSLNYDYNFFLRSFHELESLFGSHWYLAFFVVPGVYLRKWCRRHGMLVNFALTSKIHGGIWKKGGKGTADRREQMVGGSGGCMWSIGM